ncbi:sugar phosphate exchanger 3-like isoform X2 [Saccostrea echinata]|uniref:sugar phosphate exchanger 3-like isoform X2 n=1 Tax=Saccostrea echinata TaxID=191078 RepID=UPI002A80DC1B|nr:sugar phosphate exchanger 3-like isoform X2 [Saccostrea echinata]
MTKYTHHHVAVFLLTFFSYAFFHATRKTFSNVKSTISDEWSPSYHNNTVNFTKPDRIWNTRHLFDTRKDAEPYLGILDAVFMISYAVGLYISGMIGDRFNMRLVLSFGMCSSAVTVFLFGVVFEWVHFYNKYVYVIVWILNGLLQSMGWPTVVAIMGNWFGRYSRGLVLGLWSACASVGNIIGAFLVSGVLDFGYDYAFLVTSSILFAGGVVNFFGLVSTPKEVGLSLPDEDAAVHPKEYTVRVNGTDDDETINMPHVLYKQEHLVEDDDTPSHGANDNGDSEEDDTEFSSQAPLLNSPHKQSGASSSDNRPAAIGFCSALCLPGVALYALAYACLKLVNYSFFFWLPYYLHNKYRWKETVADDISIWYDVGGIIGGTIFGFISDRFQHRSIIVIPMLILGIPALFIYNSNLSNTLTLNGLLMAVVGFFIGGVANLVSAAISADLGKQGPVQGNSEALATVTGIIDGTGSVGAAIGQILVPVIQDGLGWRSVFYLFMLMTLLTALCILPLFVREVKDLYAKRRVRYSWFTGASVSNGTEDTEELFN